MPSIKICKEEGCHNSATTEGFCRLHYLRRWKEVHAEKQKRAARKLNRYIEHICRENPKDYAKAIRRDLEKPDFDKATDDFELDDESLSSFDEETNEEEIERMIRRLKIEEGF